MAINFKDVYYTYLPHSPFEYVALKGLNVTILEGKMTALIGHTGSGKSTLIQQINGLLIPSKGEVHVDDYIISSKTKLKQIKQLRKKAGIVFQFPEYQLFEETVYKDIAFGPKNFGYKDEEIKQIVHKVIKLVGLDETYLEKSPFELSGGQKRRVAIAGILAFEPDILILDEPIAGLDPKGSKEIMELFKNLNNLGKTIIIVSHDMDYVLKYCDEVILLKDGKLVKKDTPLNIFMDENLIREANVIVPNCLLLAKQLIKDGYKIDLNKIKDIPSLALEIRGNQ
ncbi:MAG: energy-coupling factor transporter ATPase [Bacilli bacterium]|nr:energy-coupling factor transporter ATPase [Bacilli bacterium]